MSLPVSGVDEIPWEHGHPRPRSQELQLFNTTIMKKTLLLTIALLCTVAQGAWATDYNVGNETELRGAIVDGANITLTQDITIGSAITFNDGITVTIDLGGHTLNRNSTSGNRSQVIGVFSGSTLNISNGTLTGGWGGDGGIINQATLNMTNVTITGNKGNDRGGGISNNGTLTMTDCTVSNNTSLDATDPAGGGGIFNYNGKTATLTNCTITGNTASTYGGGGICNYGTMTLENCSVKNNNANTTGGGIFCSTTSTLSINGCDITGNSAVSYGDGIYIDNSNFNMKGKCVVKNNNDGNIYLYGSGTVITVTGAFESGSNIGVGVTDYNRKFTSGYGNYHSDNPVNYFSGDNNSSVLAMVGNEVFLAEDLNKATNMDGAQILFTKDMTMSSALFVGNESNVTVTIDMNDHKLDRGCTTERGSQVIYVLSGSTLNLSNGTVTGGWGGDGGGILNAGTLNMTDVTITGNTADDRGGGISNNGTLSMTNCTVSNNTSKDQTGDPGGGGIYNYGTMTISSGSISSNTSYNGGAIYNNSGTVEISGATISNNTAKMNGGGIFNDGTLTINSGTITDNDAYRKGDGIYSSNDINMQGTVVIDGNRGSNLYLSGDSKVNVTGAFTEDANIQLTWQKTNRVFTSGYDTYHSGIEPDTYFHSEISRAHFTLDGGEARVVLTDIGTEGELNSAITDGVTLTIVEDFAVTSHVTINKTLTIELNGHTLTGNSTALDGDDGSFSCIFIVAPAGNLTLTNGTLANADNSLTTNSAHSAGAIVNKGTATLTNVTIQNCKGTQGGAIRNNSDATLSLNGCTLTGNSANDCGGGIYNDANATLNVSGITVTGNVCSDSGSGIYDKGSFSMEGMVNISDNSGSNLYLPDQCKVGFTGALASGSSIGVSLENNNRAFTTGYSAYNSFNEVFFFCDNTNVSLSTSGVEWSTEIPNGTIVYYDHHWEGSDTDGHVVKEHKLCTSYSNWNGTSNLTGGWYVFSGSLETNTDRITVSGDTKLILADGCSLKHKRGIYIQDGATLTIYAQSTGSNMGKLNCPSGDGDNAAIGGNADKVGGYLVIHGGDIYAEADKANAAGIGGGNHESGMRGITIWDGTIEAKSYCSGAAIGGGQQNNVWTPVTIYGGNVTAYGNLQGYEGGAGIGGGEDRGNGLIKIYGGTINATGGWGGAGIGGGTGGSLDYPVYIYGGTVNATGGELASAGIGAGRDGSQNSGIYIYGGTITATAGSNTNTTNAAGIGGGGNCGHGGLVEIHGGHVKAYGSGDYSDYDEGDSEVTAGAGIGGGNEGNGGTVRIYGGIVEAYAGAYTYRNMKDNQAAAIGGGYKGNGGNVEIYGGYVKLATRGESRPIGPGEDNSNEGSLYFDGKMKVYEEGSSPVAANERRNLLTYDETFWMYTYTVIMEECDHPSGAICEEYDDYYHHYKCSYCDGYLEAHTLGSNGKCTLCGRTLPERALTFYEANASGTGYDSGVSYYFNEGNSFTLPECSSVPDKMVFAGWKQADSAPSLLTVENSTGLLQAGETVTVGTSDCNYYALYMFTDIRGKGTEGDPYLISSIDEFNRLAYTVNHGVTLTGKYFRLDADLDFTGETFTPIGDETHQFKGSFYGNGHIISGVTVTSGTYQGIIGHLGTGGVVEACVSNSVSIVGTNDGGTITNCLRLGDTNYLFSTSGSTIGYSVESGTERLTLDYGSATASYGDRSLEVYNFDQGNDQTARGLLYDGKLYTGSETTVTFVAEANANIRHLYANNNELTTIGNSKYQMIMGSENVTITAVLDNYYVLLYDGQPNSTTITAHDDDIADVTISGRTLYKDGNWNTLCLPFNVSASQMGNYNCPLYGATVMELDVDGWYDGSTRYDVEAEGRKQTSFASGGTLYLYFQEVDEIEAGKPYIIKWASGTDITDPEFNSSEIEASDPETVESPDGKVNFIGIYAPAGLTVNDKSNLFLGVDEQNRSTLYYPSGSNNDDGKYYVNAFRAYFHVALSSISPSGDGVRAFFLHFGDDSEQTGITTISKESRSQGVAGVWYGLDGRKLAGKPTAKGVYIYKGKKRVIK